MIKTSRTILFFGTEDFSLISLRALVEAGFSIGAVITKPDARKGRSSKLLPPAVKTYALEHNITVLQPTHLSSITEQIKAYKNPVGVLVSYGKIVPQAIIDLFQPGIINVHPSLLPRHRGPSPIETALLHGDRETGVSIMQLTKEMDAGPVYAFSPLELRGTETKPDLYQTLGDIGAMMLVSILPDIVEGNAIARPQDESKVTFTKLLSKDDSLIDPQSMTAEEAERHIRAYLGYPKSRIRLGNDVVIVTKGHTTTEASVVTDITFHDGSVLSIDELVAPSGKTMTAEAYLRGHHQ